MLMMMMMMMNTLALNIMIPNRQGQEINKSDIQKRRAPEEREETREEAA